MISTKDKIKIFQKALGSLPDGIPGASTWDSALRFLEYEGYTTFNTPYEDVQFGCKVVITKPSKVRLHDTEGKLSVSEFPYSMSGSFTVVQADGKRKPVSIMVDNGVILRNDACHSAPWDGNYPETVLYHTYDGKYGTKLLKSAKELMSKVDNVQWAIGGLSMLPKFNAEAEGFVGRFSDVFRYTAHNAIGTDKYGNIVGVYHPSCTLYSFQKKCRSIGLDKCISLDGGHISAINAGDLRANTYQKQGSIIQF